MHELKVGYDKVDYECLNGRDEFRFTAEYTTGLQVTNITLGFSEPLSLRIAWQIVCVTEKSSSTDNESDNDVFIVGAMLAYNRLLESGICTRRRKECSWKIAGVLNPDAMFNIMCDDEEKLC